MFVLKFIFYFTLSFIILCVPVSQKNVFFYLDKAAAPYTKEIFSIIKKKAIEGKKIGKKFFNNSTPKVSDSVNSSYSSTQKEHDLGHHHGHHEEPYTVEEKQMLLNILKKAQ